MTLGVEWTQRRRQRVLFKESRCVSRCVLPLRSVCLSDNVLVKFEQSRLSMVVHHHDTENCHDDNGWSVQSGRDGRVSTLTHSLTHSTLGFQRAHGGRREGGRNSRAAEEEGNGGRGWRDAQDTHRQFTVLKPACLPTLSKPRLSVPVSPACSFPPSFVALPACPVPVPFSSLRGAVPAHPARDRASKHTEQPTRGAHGTSAPTTHTRRILASVLLPLLLLRRLQPKQLEPRERDGGAFVFFKLLNIYRQTHAANNAQAAMP
jgi:hypothetical protein